MDLIVHFLPSPLVEEDVEADLIQGNQVQHMLKVLLEVLVEDQQTKM
jgi:hypothetical protein